MGSPGQARREHDIEKGRGRYGSEQEVQARRVLIGRHQIEKLVQGKQHQPEPNEDAAEVMQTRARIAPEHQDADEDQRGRERGHVEGQSLHDECRANIGAEHDGEGGDEIDEAAGCKAGRHQSRRRAALQYCRHAYAGCKGAKAVAQGVAEKGAKARSEGPLDFRLTICVPQRSSAI